jgi:hypothetical protein
MHQTTVAASGSAHALEPTDGPLLPEELQLAFRNRGMPLEAMRYDLTPTGLHYLVAHWDIPALDPQTWRLRIGGEVQRPLKLTLDEVRARPARTIPVTLECAGNGRDWLRPRPVSLPWLGEAVGTAEWTGVPLRDLLADAGLEPDAVELVFLGADAGIQAEEEQTYTRSLTVAEATRPEVLLAYEMNGRPLEPQHGFPLRLIVPSSANWNALKPVTTSNESSAHGSSSISPARNPPSGRPSTAIATISADASIPATLAPRSAAMRAKRPAPQPQSSTRKPTPISARSSTCS